MKKIPTIFKRDMDNGGKILPEYSEFIDVADFEGAIATEKLDGTNIRVTIRNEVLVRIEKRRNPTKIQKKRGILDPWYVDVDEYSPEDKHITEAAREYCYVGVPNGEWSAEALGPKIQGNPLKLKEHLLCIFSAEQAPIFLNVPITFEELKEWLPRQKSIFGHDCGIEGIVWHCTNGKMMKIKTKDFIA